MEKDNCNIRCKNEVVELINNPHSKTQDVITLIQKQIEKYHYLIGTTAYIKYLYDNVGWEELNIWGRGKPMMNPDRTGYLYDELSILMEHYSELEEMEQNHLPCATQPEKSDDTKSLTPEPQQEQPKLETTATKIPTIKDTDKEKLVFGNALQKQYMSLNNGCYRWSLAKSLLAYMCGRLYCGDRIKEDDSSYNQVYIKGNTQMPAQEVKDLFGVDVASNRYSLKSPPRNSWKVDELFKSNGANK